ncbi:unnamed protein product [Triticum turgidum subsp. durum]|uniref:Uncharacterized protein n=1 Tax=Triticum turgidum subsp. durum TaxID=4567 RepID=A0A9R1S0R1_TRITD|nr:unnamed protein product [Triticum turgidum subsp. durum]
MEASLLSRAALAAFALRGGARLLPTETPFLLPLLPLLLILLATATGTLPVVVTLPLQPPPRSTRYLMPLGQKMMASSSFQLCLYCVGFFVMIWIAAVMFKSNDILRKKTALKGEKKMPMLIGIVVLFTIHVFGVYWWYRNDDLVRPLVMLPPKEIPPFWHAIFSLR